jgi:DNA polymerase-3 subunit alpha (Gram-positive type)
MSRPFFEVFPKLHVENDLQMFFDETEVERLATNSDRSRFKVELLSSHLIHRKNIVRMEKKLAEQVFRQPDCSVVIREHYQLSSQYNPERLMHEYFDSLVMEISESSHVAGNFFRDARIVYPTENEIEITMEDSCFSRDLEEKYLDFFGRVFRDRCSVPAVFTVKYEIRNRSKKESQENRWTPMTEAEIARMDTPAEENSRPAGADRAGGQPAEGSAEPLPWENAPAGTAADGVPGDGAPKHTEPDHAAAAEAPKAADSGNYQNAGYSGRSSYGGRKGSMKGPQKGYWRSNDPNCLYGRDVEEGKSTRLADIIGEIGEVTVRGQVQKIDRRDIRNNKTIVKFALTDFTDSIYGKIFIGTEYADEFLAAFTEGTNVRLRGMTQMDTFDKEVVIGSITGIMKIPSFVEKRKDNYATRRVELHCHTKMSDMDGVSECKDIVRRAYDWGMPAIAITDHGNVQAFPDANHLRADLLEKENKKRTADGLAPIDPQDFFKVIYGVECYLVDDLKPIVVFGTREMPDTAIDSRSYVVFDLETTGFSPEKNQIIEFGAVRIENGTITERFSEFVNPRVPIPYRIQQLTHITDDMVIDADTIDQVLPRFMAFSHDAVLVGHNVSFDIGFVRANAKRLGLPCDFTTVDTIGMARAELPGHANYRLDTVAKLLSVSLENHHRAVDDAECTADIFMKLLPMTAKDHADTFGRLNGLSRSDPENIRHEHPYHCILLAENMIGRQNLYTLISASNLTYFARKPRIPKSMLVQYREGIIIGSACVAGELFQAILEERSEEQIAGIVSFYDYLEIQPIANNHFLIDATEKSGAKMYPEINTDEDLRDLNRRIVKLGEQFGKPVCATCDVHFLDPDDQIYRSIIQSAGGMDDEDPAPLFLRTTDEMIAEFSYLGQKKCEEVVITNTRMIADRIDAMSPVRPDKCPPVIPHSDETLKEICYNRAHKMYGDPLPEIVQARLDKELNAIIKNGYSVMYIIAQKLVWKSNEDGYLVGSRGSVGSSFVATMAGITEVNPLQPHYYCPNCHYSDFDSETVQAYADKCGNDLPDMKCPKCGEPLKKDGFGIPFETFLGFKGDKEPDIDLNFSGEYQSKAHAYTKVIFGHEQTFKAGTIATVADKTAYGYVLHYLEDRGESRRKCEIDRLAQGITGVRRSTGQHPGGIVVLPLGENINSFTPVQHPANDMTTDIITTHFDYHSIDHNLLKLDILGHDDPTMIRMLQDLTGMDPMSIPFDDKKVMSLFTGTEALGITPDQIGGVKLGTLGIPEFGTKFVIQMLEDTQPTTFSELVRISGLSHGTDVWLGNAQTLIQEGKATLSTAICTRDDIMAYLISKGMEKSIAFKTMESVRKGKGLKPEMEAAMEEAGVPDWYMDSCRKIGYMFPRAHAAAYVMMAWRIAYCKVYRPLAYYCAYFSIRAKDFDYEIMGQGQNHLEAVMNDYRSRKDSLSQKESDTLDDMLLVQEFYARGFHFLPIDIQRADSRSFRIIDDQLMPALKTIAGLGEKAADAVVEAVKDGPFTSRENFYNRTKVPKTVVEDMDRMGLLNGLPESDQISLFDLIGQ